MPVQLDGRSITGNEINFPHAFPEASVFADPGVEHRNPDAFSPGGVVTGNTQPFEGAATESDCAWLGADLREIRDGNPEVGKALILFEKPVEVGELLKTDPSSAQGVQLPEKAHLPAGKAAEKVTVVFLGLEANDSFPGHSKEKLIQSQRFSSGRPCRGLAGEIWSVKLGVDALLVILVILRFLDVLQDVPGHPESHQARREGCANKDESGTGTSHDSF